MSEKHGILIVEDEPDHLLALQMVFENEGDFRIYTAVDTREAEGILGESKVDLVLLDIALPGESGIDFCRRIKSGEEYRDLPIIAISAYPDRVWKERAIDAGCCAFEGKPFDPKNLVSRVKQYLSA